MSRLGNSIRVGNRPLFGGGPRIAAYGCALALLFLAGPARAQNLQDYFTNRITFTNASGHLSANNSSATVETGEPKHGGKTGGHSMWMSWVAPANGVAKFTTLGSGFDTLLSVYAFNSTNDSTFDKLVEVARADDSEGDEFESEVEFGALAGRHYEVAVDGYFGATGPLEFGWNLQTTSIAPPIITSTPSDRAANNGDTFTLSIGVTNAGSAQFKWFFNGVELGVNSTNLVISNMQASKVGRYKVRVIFSGNSYFSMPIELQINTDGDTNALAQGKILDAPGSSFVGNPPPHQFSGALSGFKIMSVVRGYNGSQIFNTTYAVVDTNEPPHCGISGGASYWLAYQPPANGTLTLDTVGSSYDTVMEAYTYDGTLTGYQDLTSIACDNNSGSTNGASRVQFATVKTRQYIIAVEGVNNARGTAYLNYSLNTNQAPVAPSLLSPPQTTTVGQGSPATLAANLTGAPPLRFSWKKNNTPIPGMTARALFFPSATTNDTADYVMTVTNDLGSLSATLPLHVVIQPQCVLSLTSAGLKLGFFTVSGQRYTVQEALAVNGPWESWQNFYVGDGNPLVLDLPGGGTKFYRVRVE